VTDLHRFRRRSIIDFLGELCASVKRVDAHAKTTIVLLPQDLNQVDELAMLPHLDTIGCHPFWGLLGEDIAMVDIWGQTVVEAAHRYKKRSQLWLQNFSLDEQGEQFLEPSFTKLFNAEPDEIGCYYYWRNNVNPGRVWQTTRSLLHRIPRRQLYWRSTPPCLPVVPPLSAGDIKRSIS
jgi:hypothetical protein